jgi:hypothetical protein
MENKLKFLLYNTQQENVQIPAINKHLSNIYENGELDKKPTISILEIVPKKSVRNITRKIEFYNLNAIISIGYRIKSHIAIRGDKS